MEEYKRYKLKYYMLSHGEVMVYTRLYRGYEAMLEALTEIRQKKNYIKHKKYEVYIKEVEID